MTGGREVPFGEAARFWLTLGFISFGGPAGQIAIMHRELVVRRRWISEERFLHALNYCMLLPGPEAQQLATYIGWLLHRTRGGLVAGGLFVLPSAFILLGLSHLYAAYGTLPIVAGILSGLRPVVVAVIVEAVWRVGTRALVRGVHRVVAVSAFLAIYALGIPFPLIIAGAGLAGLAVSRRWPGATGTPTEAHAPPSRGRTVRIAAAGVALWAAPLALISLVAGAGALHMEIYRYFTGLAFVTFGGAYAVLASVTQTAVDGYGWLTAQQAVDGLALAETTPGPLVMVLQFVGYMAGWNHPGAMTPSTSAVLAAAITTWVTFLPSFLFIFIGAPYIEMLRGNRGLAGALTSVTAAVVGVMLNLAVVLGVAVLWPGSEWREPDWWAAVTAAVALGVLIHWRVGVAWMVVAGGLLGLVRAFVV